MNRKTANAFLADLQKASDEIARRHGVQASVRGTFSGTGARFNVTLKDLTVTETGTSVTAIAIQMASILGKDINKTVSYQGENFTVVDYRPKARRYPWVARGDVTGREICFPDTMISSRVPA